MIVALTSVILAVASLTAAQNVLNITVGQSAGSPDVLVFTPANVTAAEGDIVRFIFSGAPGNHSVTQSSFAAPCEPLNGGFDSGNVRIPAGTTGEFPTWELTVTNASRPIWFFCKQNNPAPHCNAGMVGSINAPETENTFEVFQAAARNHQGLVNQSVGGLVGVGASASAVPGPFSGSVTGFGLPSATVPGGNTAATNTNGPATTETSNSASSIQLSGMYLVIATFFGVVLA